MTVLDHISCDVCHENATAIIGVPFSNQTHWDTQSALTHMRNTHTFTYTRIRKLTKYMADRV